MSGRVLQVHADQITHTFPGKCWEYHLNRLTLLELVQHLGHEHRLANPFLMVLFSVLGGNVLPVTLDHIKDLTGKLSQLLCLGRNFRDGCTKACRIVSRGLFT